MLRWISIWEKEKKMTRNSLSIWQVSFRLWLTEKWKMRTSIKCRKTNTNVITTANENSRLQQANCLKRGKTRDQVASITNEIPVYFPHSIQNRSKTHCMFQTELEVVLSPFILRHLRTPSSLSFLMTLNGTCKLLLGFS